jgi:serine/threonine protein kinase
VKVIFLSELTKGCQVETEIEDLLNLRHPMITNLIGRVSPVESSGWLEFETMRLHATESFLVDVLSNPHAWWTPSWKARAIVEIAFGVRFVHGLELLHDFVKASNILCDADRRIQIADFSPIRPETGAVEPFSGTVGVNDGRFRSYIVSFWRSRLVAFPLSLSV